MENNSALFNAHLSKFITLSTGHNKKELISIKESNIVLLYLINVKFDDNNLNHVKDFVEIRDKFGLNHQQAALNMILLILDFSNTSDMVDEYNIKPLELFFAKNLFGKEVLENMRENLKNDTILMAQMKKFTHKRLFYDTTVKSYEILCLLQHSSSVVEAVEINELIQDAIGQPDSLKQVMFKYIGICLFICPDFEDIDYMFLLELSTDGSVSLKYCL